MSSLNVFPTIDLSPFFTPGDNEGKKKVKELMYQACTTHGFFQVVNHGVPIDLIDRAMEVSKIFFDYPDEEKLKSSPGSVAPLPVGYNKQHVNAADKKEYILMFPPKSTFNVLPANPPEFKGVVEELFSSFVKAAKRLEVIVAECLGLPPDFFEKFNDNGSCDIMVAFRYYQATESENMGNSEHADGNCITFVLQDEVGGLEVEINGEWVPVTPTKGTLVVKIGDMIQVLSSNICKSCRHRVVRTKGRSRYSYVFFINLEGEKVVEPLLEFTEAIGELPKYRKIVYKEYQSLRLLDIMQPPSPSSPEHRINITHYSIPS